MLFVVKNININFLNQIKALYPNSRAVFWDPFVPYLKSLRHAIELATNIVAEDEIADHVSARYDVSVIKLSEYDLSLAKKVRSKIPRSKSNINGQALNNDELLEVANGPVLFCPSNDTHTKLFEPIAKLLSDARFLLFDQRAGENARQMLESLGLKYEVGGAERLSDIRPSAIVVGNDWYRTVWELFEKAYRMKIPTVCLQEGCLDFATKRRMQRCDYALIQGPIMLQYLPQKIYFLTGNPRFDQLKSSSPPKKQTVMVNCNFTYGVHEEARESWISDVVRACKELQVDFFISQHPRDRGEFPDYPVRKSHAGVVHTHIADCSILVTRFSTLVYEAMLSGRQVIYYNPHGEKMRLFNEDTTGGIYKSHHYAALVESLHKAIQPMSTEQRDAHQLFLEWHCGENDGLAARRCASALDHISNIGYPRTGRNTLDWYNYWKARNIRDNRARPKGYKAVVRRRLLAVKRKVSRILYLGQDL
jgi:hypothetical protein